MLPGCQHEQVVMGNGNHLASMQVKLACMQLEFESVCMECFTLKSLNKCWGYSGG